MDYEVAEIETEAKDLVPESEAKVLAKWLPAVGASKSQVAKLLGIDIMELKEKHWDDFSAGRLLGLGQVANRVYMDAITNPGATGLKAAMFLLQTQANWKVTEKREVSGDDGAPLVIAVDAPRRESMEEFLERRNTNISVGVMNNDAVGKLTE